MLRFMPSTFCRKAQSNPKSCSADPQGGYLCTAAAASACGAAFYATAKTASTCLL